MTAIRRGRGFRRLLDTSKNQQHQQKPMNIAANFKRYARHEQHACATGPCACGLTEAITVVEQNELANDCDRNSLQVLIDMLEAALPNFKGAPAPTDWARLALSAVIVQRAELLTALQACLPIVEAVHEVPPKRAEQARAAIASCGKGAK